MGLSPGTLPRRDLGDRAGRRVGLAGDGLDRCPGHTGVVDLRARGRARAAPGDRAAAARHHPGPRAVRRRSAPRDRGAARPAGEPAPRAGDDAGRLGRGRPGTGRGGPQGTGAAERRTRCRGGARRRHGREGGTRGPPGGARRPARDRSARTRPRSPDRARAALAGRHAGDEAGRAARDRKRRDPSAAQLDRRSDERHRGGSCGLGRRRRAADRAGRWAAQHGPGRPVRAPAGIGGAGARAGVASPISRRT